MTQVSIDSQLRHCESGELPPAGIMTSVLINVAD